MMKLANNWIRLRLFFGVTAAISVATFLAWSIAWRCAFTNRIANELSRAQRLQIGIPVMWETDRIVVTDPEAIRAIAAAFKCWNWRFNRGGVPANGKTVILIEVDAAECFLLRVGKNIAMVSFWSEGGVENYSGTCDEQLFRACEQAGNFDFNEWLADWMQREQAKLQ